MTKIDAFCHILPREYWSRFLDLQSSAETGADSSFSSELDENARRISSGVRSRAGAAASSH